MIPSLHFYIFVCPPLCSAVGFKPTVVLSVSQSCCDDLRVRREDSMERSSSTLPHTSSLLQQGILVLLFYLYGDLARFYGGKVSIALKCWKGKGLHKSKLFRMAELLLTLSSFYPSSFIFHQHPNWIRPSLNTPSYYILWFFCLCHH